MLYPIFPSQKTRYEGLLWLVGIVAVIACFFMNDYWFYRALPENFSQNKERMLDSMLTEVKFSRDSVEIYVEPSVDESLLEAVHERYGASSRLYLDTAHVQPRLFRARIAKREGGNFGIRFGSGNRSRPRTKSKTTTEDNHIRTVWFDDHINIVGEVRPYRDTMPKIQLPNGLPTVVYDTLAIRRHILNHIPLVGFSAGIHANTIAWQRDTAFPGAIGFVAVIAQDSFLRKEWMLRATKTSDTPEAWNLEWQYRVVLLNTSSAENSSDFSLKSVVPIVFWGVVIILSLYLGVIFLNRMRIKAISLWLLLLAPIAGLGFTLGNVPTTLPWYGYIMIWIFFTIGFGFFLNVVPFSALVSVLQEQFPEKFYTLKRTFDKPWTSYHWGRMVLAGISIGAVYSVSSLIIPMLGERFDSGLWAVAYQNTQAYLLPYMSSQPLSAILSTICQYVPMSMIITLVPIVLTFRYVPRAFAPWVMVIVLMISWALYCSVLSLNLGFILVQGALFAIPCAIVFYYYDWLALLVFTIVSSVLLSLALFVVESWGLYLPITLLIGLIVPAFVALRNDPEKVTESDYKPEYLTLIEENKRLHQEIEAAKSVQQKLLPRNLPVIERVRLSAACIPAYEVGGDYYDFFPLDEKRLGVLIGDVSGKGISAAFYITLAKGVIVSQVRGIGSPSDILHRVNALLYGVMERGKFVSMIYGIYDISTREFSFANAGHNPLVVLRANGDIATVAAKGMAIGLDKGERFEKAVSTMSVLLEENDCVLLYTDGVTEAMNTDHTEYGEERMIAALRTAPLRADDIVSTALADVRKFAGKAHQHDDITLVALQAV